MNRLYELAQLLVGCWLLTGEDPAIPVSDGVLDQALSLAVQRGAFPDWARATLHFADSRLGLHCVELPDILAWAQTAELIIRSSLNGRVTYIQIDSKLAKRLLHRLGVADEDAHLWGRTLREAVVEVQTTIEEYPAAEPDEA